MGETAFRQDRRSLPVLGARLALLALPTEAIALEKPGKFEYFCVYHRFMTGTGEGVE